ncbi:MAG: glycosyltransferase family 2 protein [Pseudomonadota bacterium]
MTKQTAQVKSDKNKILVIIPAMNEEKTIGKVISQVKKLGFDVLVIDDNSKDNTISLAKENGALVIPLVYNIGAWNATQTGFQYALKKAYPTVITMDADGQHDPLTLPDLIQAQKETRANVIIASFTARGNLNRQLAWRFFKWFAGFNINDLTSGYRLYDHKALAVIASKEATLLEYQDVGVLLLLAKHHLSLTEIETRMSYRIDGVSRIFKSWLHVVYYLLYTSILCLSKIKTVKTKH